MAVKQGLLCPLCRDKRRSDLRNPDLLQVWAEDKDVKWRYRGSLPWFDFCGDCHEKVWVNDSRKPRNCKPGVSRWQCQVRGMYVRQAPPELVDEPVAKPVREVRAALPEFLEEPVAKPEHEDVRTAPQELLEEPVATREREDKSPTPKHRRMAPGPSCVATSLTRLSRFAASRATWGQNAPDAPAPKDLTYKWGLVPVEECDRCGRNLGDKLEPVAADLDDSVLCPAPGHD